MKYVIDDNDLDNLWRSAFDSNHPLQTMVNWGKEIKSKTPVEEIAEGEVLIDFESGTTDILQGSNLKPIENIFKKEHRNVPVKIYIEVIK